jgi:hypothetical protein
MLGDERIARVVIGEHRAHPFEHGRDRSRPGKIRAGETEAQVEEVGVAVDEPRCHRASGESDHLWGIGRVSHGRGFGVRRVSDGNDPVSIDEERISGATVGEEHARLANQRPAALLEAGDRRPQARRSIVWAMLDEHPRSPFLVPSAARTSLAGQNGRSSDPIDRS